MYELSTDSEMHRIEARIHGFLEERDLARLVYDMRFLARSLRCHGGAHDLLCDLTDAMVGSQAAARTLSLVINDDAYRHLRARRIAFYTPSALMQMQMGRIAATRVGAAVFADREAAEAWLAAADEQSFHAAMHATTAGGRTAAIPPR